MKSKVAVRMKIMYYAMSRKNVYTVVALHCEEIVNPWYFLSINPYINYLKKCHHYRKATSP